MSKIPQTTLSLVLLLIALILNTGCGTTGSTNNRISKEAPVFASIDDQEVEINKDDLGFFSKNKELIVAKANVIIDRADEKGINEEQIREVKERLKEGWDVDILGFFSLNASSDGLKYEKRFLEDDTGHVKTGVDKDGDFFFQLAIVF